MLLTKAQIQNINTNHEANCFKSTPREFYTDYLNDLRINNTDDTYANNGLVKSFTEYLQTDAIDDYKVLVELAIEQGEYTSIISFAEWVNRK